MILRPIGTLLLGAFMTIESFGIPAEVVNSQTGATFANVQHAYGLPGTKRNDKGTLTVTSEGFAFAAKAGNFAIQRLSVIAVSAGNERVELWGTKGRLLRMAIPNGGGLAAAGVMQHKLDMLTVEFTDSRGGYHAAVFFLSANDAERAVESFSQMPIVQHEVRSSGCQGSSVSPRTVLVSTPEWNQTDAPAAYRGLVYEHLIDRLRRLDGIGHAYREGENDSSRVCPQYTIQISIVGFKQGSQVKRAVTGPVGFFVGTTQMTIEERITDASGRLHVQEQVKATVRGESESKNVADRVAKSLAKHYAEVQKKFAKGTMVESGTL